MQSGKPPEQQKRWDEVYVQKDFFGSEPSELGLRARDLFLKEGVHSVLELGCGQGRDTWLFARTGLDVIALDYSDAGICQMKETAKAHGLESKVSLKAQDARLGIPLPDNSIDAVYSHMFLCMELTEKQLEHVMAECLRVLKPGGWNVYSVRNEHDPHYKKFEHKGEDMYQNPMGLVVHFFDEAKVRRLAQGYTVEWIREFQDTSPPFVKQLYEVVLRKPK